MTTKRRDLVKAIHIASVETEARVLLEKAINDLNTLKHRTFSEELREDLNTAMDLLEKHREALNFRNVAESILNELNK